MMDYIVLVVCATTGFAGYVIGSTSSWKRGWQSGYRAARDTWQPIADRR